MIHGLKEFGLTVELDQGDDLIELIKRVKFGFCQGLDIAASRLSQGQYGVAVFEVSGLGFGREQALVSPEQSLSVDLGQGEEGSSRKKILFNVLDISFHASFFMG
jgi:hypothetical protein